MTDLRKIKFSKSSFDQVEALHNYLLIILDEIEILANSDSSYRIPVLSGILRLLICDNSTKGGLLVRLVKKYGYEGFVESENGQKRSLEEFRHKIMMSVYKGNGGEGTIPERTQTLCNIIANEAQQDGGAHSSDYRTFEHNEVRTVLGMGNSAKTNPRQGLLLQVADKIILYGINFLDFVEYQKISDRLKNYKD